MNKKEFIEKWNVGYESLEQKAEFAAEMESDLNEVFEQMRLEVINESVSSALPKAITLNQKKT